MDSNPGSDPLPKPRLILRVGGVGNRKFGSENDIDEVPKTIRDTAIEACRAAFNQIDRILLEIQEDDRNALWPNDPKCPWWKTHASGRVFGKADRWERIRISDLPASVFSDEKPRVTVFTGD